MEEQIPGMKTNYLPKLATNTCKRKSVRKKVERTKRKGENECHTIRTTMWQQNSTSCNIFYCNFFSIFISCFQSGSFIIPSSTFSSVSSFCIFKLIINKYVHFMQKKLCAYIHERFLYYLNCGFFPPVLTALFCVIGSHTIIFLFRFLRSIKWLCTWWSKRINRISKLMNPFLPHKKWKSEFSIM